MNTRGRIRQGVLGVITLVTLQSMNLAYGFAVPDQNKITRTGAKRREWPAPVFSSPNVNLEEETIMKRTPMDILSAPLQMDFSNATTLEMAGMSALGLAFSVGVIYSLASANPLGDKELESKAIETVYSRVVDAALPRDATDIISGILGESIGGFIGAVSTTVVTATLSLRMEVKKKAVLVGAVADGDYFLTRAATLPLLTGLGIPEEVAGIASVLFATVPYEMVKLNSKRRVQRQSAEDIMMDQLLIEQQLEQEKVERGLFFRQTSAGPRKPEPQGEERTIEGPVVEIEKLIDIPEIFADVIKWLEFDILRSDFTGGILGPNANTGLESAAFGFLAGLSAQLYLDVVRTYTDYGPEEKREEARTRTLAGWVSLYSNECLSTAALFGVYETVKDPVSLFVTSVLSRGVDGCLGSTDIKACLDTYMLSNPAEATLQGQIRSLATTLVSLWDRISLDGGIDSDQFSRAAVVQMFNIINHAM